MFKRHIPAAIIPGAARPICSVAGPGIRSYLPNVMANEPSTGPSATPRLVVAESQPSARARSCGGGEPAPETPKNPPGPPPAPDTTPGGTRRTDRRRTTQINEATPEPPTD